MLCIPRFTGAPFKTQAENLSAIFINYSLPIYHFYSDSYFTSLVYPILLKQVRACTVGTKAGSKFATLSHIKLQDVYPMPQMLNSSYLLSSSHAAKRALRPTGICFACIKFMHSWFLLFFLKQIARGACIFCTAVQLYYMNFI